MKRGVSAIALGAGAVLLSGAAELAPTGEVRVAVSGLRSARGQVLACLTAHPRAFPDCAKDPAAHKLTVPALSAAAIDFTGIAPGNYAIALVHDENGNGKMDMMLFMPREGFGFSRDAPARMGPPSFASAAFAVAGGEQRQTIRIRYMM